MASGMMNICNSRQNYASYQNFSRPSYDKTLASTVPKSGFVVQLSAKLWYLDLAKQVVKSQLLRIRKMFGRFYGNA